MYGFLDSAPEQVAPCGVHCGAPGILSRVTPGDPAPSLDRPAFSLSSVMSTALSLQADGLRGNGRWKRGSVDKGESAISGWVHRMKEAGHVLDELPELAAKALVNIAV